DVRRDEIADHVVRDLAVESHPFRALDERRGLNAQMRDGRKRTGGERFAETNGGELLRADDARAHALHVLKVHRICCSRARNASGFSNPVRRSARFSVPFESISTMVGTPMMPYCFVSCCRTGSLALVRSAFTRVKRSSSRATRLSPNV